ncbi:MAG: SurA N-terminal domain-containing protein [Anaerolineae bacterium]|nr:SurA N-terminal domain-containing protein [Anaerolineae bacterium]
MKDLFSKTHLSLGTLLFSLLLTSCHGTATISPSPDVAVQPEQQAPSTVIVTVNGQPITMEAFQRELARFEAGQASLGLQVADQKAYKQQVLEQLVEQELLRQLATSKGIIISDETVNAELSAMTEQNGQEYFEAWLKSNYYTLAEFREVIRLQLMTNQLTTPVVEAVPTVTEQVHARHILVNTQAEAEQLLARIQAGEEFGELAAQYSLDVTTKAHEGDLGWFPRGGLLVPEVEDAAFSMSPGQTASIVVSAWGAHIIQTIEIDPGRPVEPETHDRLVQKAIEDWRLGLRSGADIQQLVAITS